jgi:hypothetical protein
MIFSSRYCHETRCGCAEAVLPRLLDLQLRGRRVRILAPQLRIANATATLRTMLNPMRATAKSVMFWSTRRNSAEFAMRSNRAASAGSELEMRTISSVVVSGDWSAR